MVKLEIKREWMVLLVVALSFLAVSFVVSQSNPSVFGHSASEIQGVVPNCATLSSDPACTSLNSAPGGGWTARDIIAPYSAYNYRSQHSDYSDNSGKLEGKSASEVASLAKSKYQVFRVDVNEDVFGTSIYSNGGTLRSIQQWASYCSAGSMDYGCCHHATTSLCRLNGYDYSVAGWGWTCGRGYCKGSSPCTIEIQCEDIPDFSFP